MNLDDLKTTWEKRQIQYSQSEIESIFEIKTKRSINSVNRTMFMDYTLMMIAAGGLIALTFLLGLKSRYTIATEIMVLTSLMIIHYTIKYRLLNTKTILSENIKESLTRLSRRLTLYMLMYRIIIPIFIGVLYIQLQWNLMSIRQRSLYDSMPELLPVIPLVGLSYLVIRWVSKKMYGKQLQKLIKLKNQLTHEFEGTR